MLPRQRNFRWWVRLRFDAARHPCIRALPPTRQLQRLLPLETNAAIDSMNVPAIHAEKPPHFSQSLWRVCRQSTISVTMKRSGILTSGIVLPTLNGRAHVLEQKSIFVRLLRAVCFDTSCTLRWQRRHVLIVLKEASSAPSSYKMHKSSCR